MEYVVSNKSFKQRLFARVFKQIEEEHKEVCVRYIDLGRQIVRVICYAAEILKQMELQLTYTLRTGAEHYDATIVVWQENDIRHFLSKINAKFDLGKNLHLRLDYLLCRQFYIRLRENCHLNSTFFEADDRSGRIRAYDADTKTSYVAWRSMKAEDIMLDGHLFVQQLYRICNLPARHLVHGAVVGMNETGILFGARGGRGKSTLTVKALLDGFDYVSDDYLLLDEQNNQLLASPIYSIITLTPKMQQMMGADFAGEYISANARGDKNVFNMAEYHQYFKINYPIKMLMFPHITSDEKPSIAAYPKGEAVAQLIHSTILQTGDIYNTDTVRKLLDFLKPLKCYKINLCPNIAENTQCLRQFLTTYKE